jgi:hypothetical protein
MRALAAVLALLSLALLTALPAQAHEHVCIKGSTATPLTEEGAKCGADQDLEFIVGWRSEPAVTGQLNGLDLGVRYPGNQTPVEDLASTLTAQYEYGGQVKQLVLDDQFGKPGWYTDSIIPTKEGTYTVRIGGAAVGHAISFTVDPEAVDPAGDLQFPVKDPSPGELQDQITALQQKVASLQPTQGSVNVQPDGSPAKGAPGFEPLLLLAGVAVAVLVARRR